MSFATDSTIPAWITRFTHLPQQLCCEVHDYVNPLAIQIYVEVGSKREDQRLWLFRECSRFNPIGDVKVHLRTEFFFPIGQNSGYDRTCPKCGKEFVIENDVPRKQDAQMKKPSGSAKGARAGKRKSRL